MSDHTEFLAEHRDEVAELVRRALPAVEYEAVEHLARAKGKVLAMDFVRLTKAECWLTAVERENGEQRYRRGYHQGYSDALDALRPDCNPSAWSAVAKWCDSALYAWRRRAAAHGVEVEPPPRYAKGDGPAAPLRRVR